MGVLVTIREMGLEDWPERDTLLWLYGFIYFSWGCAGVAVSGVCWSTMMVLQCKSSGHGWLVKCLFYSCSISNCFGILSDSFWVLDEFMS